MLLLHYYIGSVKQGNSNFILHIKKGYQTFFTHCSFSLAPLNLLHFSEPVSIGTLDLRSRGLEGVP